MQLDVVKDILVRKSDIHLLKRGTDDWVRGQKVTVDVQISHDI